MRSNVADLQLELENPGPRATREQRGADWIRQARAYRGVGIYDVTPSEIAAGEPVVVQDVAAVPRYLTAIGSMRAEATFPIRAPSSGVIVVTLDVESDRRDAFTAGDASFLQGCASILVMRGESNVPREAA